MESEVVKGDTLVEQGYFAQFTDIHVGGNELAGEDNLIAKIAKPGQALAEVPIRRMAEQHLIAAIEEIETLVPQPSFMLVTADLVSLGSEGELRRYCELVRVLLGHVFGERVGGVQIIE